MKFLYTLILFLSFFICQSQVNTNNHKVKSYYRKDGTYVKSHYRTNRNNTNRDNYSTKPNPWTGKKGYINPDNQTNYSRPIYYPKTSNYTKTTTTKKPISNYYPTSGNSKTTMIAKLRNKPDVFGDVMLRIPKGAKVQKIRKEDDYWKVQYGNWTGYLNEMYLSSSTSQSKIYNTNHYSSNKSVSNYYPTSGNTKTTMIAKLRNKPDVFGDIIIKIPKGAKVQKIRKEDDYWKVQYGNWTGYLNEMYIE
jgi:hypothetical protein